MPTRDPETVLDDGFRRLLASPRLQRLLERPPPRRASTPESDVPRHVGAGLVLVTMVPIGLVAGLFCVVVLVTMVTAIIEGPLGRGIGPGVCVAVVCGGVAASCWFACRAAWRSLSPRRRFVRHDPKVERKAARVLSTARRAPRLADVEVFGPVELEFQDGTRAIRRARRSVSDALQAGDMGVAFLDPATGRLVDFVVLFEIAEGEGG